MLSGQTDHQAEGLTVIVADPVTARRQHLARRTRRWRAVEAASLSEVVPLAEELSLQAIAIAEDFLVEPEVDGLIRLAGLLGCRIFVYSASGQMPANSALRGRLPCVAATPADSLDDLLARVSAPGRAMPAQPALRLPDLILIGASTGGVAAVEAVLAAFPADCPPTLVVQHMRDGFVPGLVQRMNNRCRPRIVEATDGMVLTRGTVCFAADTTRHLTLAGKASPRCALLATPAEHGHRPAVDPLFRSAVPWAANVSAALLTGMGVDGAAGLGALRAKGAFTVAQSRESSVVWGMPRAAVEAGAAEAVLDLTAIAGALLVGRSRLAADTARWSTR